MNSIRLLNVGKLPSIVRLDHVRRIPKVTHCTLYKVYRAVAAVLILTNSIVFFYPLVSHQIVSLRQISQSAQPHIDISLPFLYNCSESQNKSLFGEPDDSG